MYRLYFLLKYIVKNAFDANVVVFVVNGNACAGMEGLVAAVRGGRGACVVVSGVYRDRVRVGFIYFDPIAVHVCECFEP